MAIKRIALLWADPEDCNKGIAALAVSTIMLLEQIAEEADARFEYYSNLVKGSSILDLDGKRVEVRELVVPTTLLGFSRCIIKPRRFFECLLMDYILDIGAGDSYSDIYGERRFRLINGTKHFFAFLRKRQMLLPQTIGPFESRRLERSCVRTMKKMQLILVRDQLSADFVCERVRRPAVHVIDLAFFLPDRAVPKHDVDRINVGINISALLWNGGYTSDNQFHLRFDYRNMVLKVIERFLVDERCVVHLVPNVLLDHFDVENDYEVCRKVRDLSGNERLLIAPFFFSPMEVKAYISSLDFFTGARMHSCILAFSAGVPVFPMAYSRKFTGLFVETLNYSVIGDMRGDDEGMLVDKLFNAYSRREELSREIAMINEERILPQYRRIKVLLKSFLCIKD
jgi:colanic acid/amylovoran biosynthesis protein